MHICKIHIYWHLSAYFTIFQHILTISIFILNHRESGHKQAKMPYFDAFRVFCEIGKIQNLRRYRKENSKISETFTDNQSETLEIFSSLDITFHLKMYKFKRHKIHCVYSHI